MDKIELVVDSDHLERIARATALTGLSELIWNALDAEASSVNVVLEPSPIAGEEGIVEIRVIDDGHGMTPSEAERGFGNLGGSWKARAERSKHGAVALHGRAGQGRFKAFALGDRIQWDTVSTTPTRSSSTHLLITRESLKRCLITQQVAESPDSGTTVVVQNLRSRAQRLADSERLFSRLTAVFASVSVSSRTSRFVSMIAPLIPSLSSHTLSPTTWTLRPTPRVPSPSRSSSGRKRLIVHFIYVTLQALPYTRLLPASRHRPSTLPRMHVGKSSKSKRNSSG